MRLIPIFNKAMNLNRTLGTRTAAGYLRNQGVSFEGALYLLCARYPRKSI
jgi:hypothetical protein